MEVSGQPRPPVALPQRKKPGTLLNRRLGGPQRLSGSFGENKNELLVPGFERIYKPVLQINLGQTVNKKK